MDRASLAGAFRIRFVSVLTVIYLVFVLVVTLFPRHVDASIDPYLTKVLIHLHAHGVPDFVDYDFVQNVANVLFFVPVGFLLELLLPLRLWWLAPLLGGALSAFVETCQGLFLPDRTPSLADVATNTTGAIAGTILAVCVRMLILHRDALVIRDVQQGRRAESGIPIRR